MLEWDGQIIATTGLHPVRGWIKRALFGNGGVPIWCRRISRGHPILHSNDDSRRRRAGALWGVDGRFLPLMGPTDGVYTLK